MPHLYAPQFPHLMAKPGPKCGKWANRPAGLVALRCVKGHHGGKHLMDVDPRMVDPKYLAGPLPGGHVLKGS